jgi:hypothetical protein
MAKLAKPARDRISATKFAFPKQRKEPLENASHVRNAVARFNQVKGVTEVERRAAWKRIQSAAKRFGVHSHARKDVRCRMNRGWAARCQAKPYRVHSKHIWLRHFWRRTWRKFGHKKASQ